MRNLLNKIKVSDSRSYSSETLNRFISHPDFPWLISYPRTGSHWLRMLMELYFEKPSLIRSFYYHNSDDFTCYHQHDEELSIAGVRHVIYLYRDPVDTIYSQLNYYKCDIDNPENINKYLMVYRRHLEKWLLDEEFSTKKVTIKYDRLKEHVVSEFSKLVNFYNSNLDHQKLENIVNIVDKKVLSKKTKHDPQVVNTSEEYSLRREYFRSKFANVIEEYLFERKELRDFF